jgi:hypothetical protein
MGCGSSSIAVTDEAKPDGAKGEPAPVKDTLGQARRTRRASAENELDAMDPDAMDFTLTDSDEEDDGVAEGDRGRLRKESRMERLSFQVRPWPRLPRFPVTPAASFHCRAKFSSCGARASSTATFLTLCGWPDGPLAAGWLLLQELPDVPAGLMDNLTPDSEQGKEHRDATAAAAAAASAETESVSDGVSEG